MYRSQAEKADKENEGEKVFNRLNHPNARLRDEFAMAALAGLTHRVWEPGLRGVDQHEVADWAYAIADAMLARRLK